MASLIDKIWFSNRKTWLGLLAVLFAMKFAVLPAVAWIDGLKADIARIQQQINRKTALKGDRESIAGSLAAMQGDEERYGHIFYKGGGDAGRIQLLLQKQLERFAGQSDIEIVNLDWLPAAKMKPLLVAPIKVRCRGTLEHLATYIARIEGNEKYYAVQGMRINADPAKSFLNAELDVAAYGLIDKELTK